MPSNSVELVRERSRATSLLFAPLVSRSALLIRLRGRRELETHAAVVVLFAGRVEIEIGDGHLAGVSGRQIEESVADDGVVFKFDFATVFENEQSGYLGRLGS